MRSIVMTSARPILFFARDPGGAAALIPVIAACAALRRRHVVYGKDYALRAFKRSGIPAKTLHGRSLSTAGKFLDRLKPGFVLTATSADDMTERWLWKASAARGISSAALLDHWINYGIRFSRYFLKGLTAYHRDRRHPYLPTGIFVMDEFARRCMAREGIPRKIIAVTGQPNFSTIQDRCLAAGRRRDTIRKAWGVRRGERVVLFASEPLSSQLGPRARRQLGYDERTTVASLCAAMCAADPAVRGRLRIVLRPHPKEDPEILRRIVRDAGCPQVIVSGRFESAEAIAAADAVCGMVSTVLVEAAIAGVPVFSIQIGARKSAPFILEQRKIARVARTRQALGALLRAVADDTLRLRQKLLVVDRPVDRILEKVDALLCHN